MEAITGNPDHIISHAVTPITRYPGGVVVVEINHAYRYAYGVLRDGSVLVRDQSDSREHMEKAAERFSRALSVDHQYTAR